MKLQSGTDYSFIETTTTGPETISRPGTTEAASILVAVYVTGITSGTLTIKAYTLTRDDQEVEVISFPVLSAPTATLLLRKAGVTMSRFRIEAVCTGVCSFQVVVRAIDAIGEANARILGNNTWSVSRIVVGTSPVELVPTSLSDRQGVLLKNWSTSQTVYIAETSGKADIFAYPLAPRDAIAIDIAAGASVYGVSDAAGADIRIAQAGGT